MRFGIVLAFGTLLLLSSCIRSYRCTCETTVVSDDTGVVKDVFYIDRYDKYNAERRCFAHQYQTDEVGRVCVLD